MAWSFVRRALVDANSIAGEIKRRLSASSLSCFPYDERRSRRWKVRKLVAVATAQQSIIRVEGLVKRFGDVTAVDGISFEVFEGEIFGILGPNGAGKTTTLEMIETLQTPTAGSIFVDGIDALRRSWDVKRRIGVQLQSASFYPDLTLVELLHLF